MKIRKNALALSLAIVAISAVAVKWTSTTPQPSQASVVAVNVSYPSDAAVFFKDYQRPSSIPYPADNSFTTDRHALGKALYFDPRLSRSGTVSCATCHNPSFSWGDALPKGVGDHMNELGRRSPTILNLAWVEPLFWDGRAATLEEQALGPIASKAEMNMDLGTMISKLNDIKGYHKMFEAAYPGEGISNTSVAKAIATFERGVVSGEAPFDRWIKGDPNAISPAAQRGFVLFNTGAGCNQCHSGWAFTDGSFQDIGVDDNDMGRFVHVPLPSMKHAFKTPGLRNVAMRAPFMHNGSEKTLEEVVEFYNVGGRAKRDSLSPLVRPLNLSDDDKRNLVEFMKTLTSEDAPVTVPTLPR